MCFHYRFAKYCQFHCLKHSSMPLLMFLVMTIAFVLLTPVSGLLFWICLPLDCFLNILTQACYLTRSCDYCLNLDHRSLNKDPHIESTRPTSSLQYPNDFWHKIKMDNFDPYKVFMAIATNIPQRLKTAFVLQGHN